MENFKEFSAEARQFDTQELKNITEMQTAIKKLPKITELKSRYTIHITLGKECSNRFNDNLKTIITREQEFATQQDFKNSKLKTSTRVSTLKELLANKNLDEASRARLVLIHTASEGSLDKSTRSSLEEVASFGAKAKFAIDTLLNILDKNPPKIEPYKKVNKKEISNTAEFYRLLFLALFFFFGFIFLIIIKDTSLSCCTSLHISRTATFLRMTSPSSTLKRLH